MAKYLLIESRDPFESNDVENHYALASSLAKDGDTVTLLLVQNGVFPARKSARTEALEKVAKAGVEILADEFSLRERGIDAARLPASVKKAASSGCWPYHSHNSWPSASRAIGWPLRTLSPTAKPKARHNWPSRARRISNRPCGPASGGAAAGTFPLSSKLPPSVPPCRR